MTHLYELLVSIAPLQDDTWKEVKQLFSEKELPKGSYFAESGKFARQIGFLKSGIVRAYYRNAQQVEFTKHFFTSNSIIGDYSSLLTRRPGKMYLQACTDSSLLVANYSDIQKLYDKYPDIERLGRRMTELFFVQKEEREAELVLLEPEKLYRLFRQQFPRLEEEVSETHLASYLGISIGQLHRLQRRHVD